MGNIKPELTFGLRAEVSGDLNRYANIIFKPNSTVNNNILSLNARYAKDDQLVIKGNGHVGIGTSAPESLLTVAGSIYAREILVDADAGDFVFEKDYNLKSLEEVEKFIERNGHLPNMPAGEKV